MRKRNRLYNEANVLPDNLELNDEFVGTFNLIENTSENIFITGKAGTANQPYLNISKRTPQKMLLF